MQEPRVDRKAVHFFCNADFRFMGVARAQLIRYLHRMGFLLHLWKQKENELNPELNRFIERLHNSPKSCFPGTLGKILGRIGFALKVLPTFIIHYRRTCSILVSAPNDSTLLGWIIKMVCPHIFWMVYVWDPPGIHAVMHGIRSKMRGLLIKAYQRALLDADLVIVGVHPVGMKGYRLIPQRTVVVTNGVDPYLFNPKGVSGATLDTAKKFRVLMVEKSQLSSGLKELMAATSKTLPAIPNIQLDLVGFMERDSRNLIAKWAREFGIEGHVIYHGLQPHERLPYYISRAHVCVLCWPSGPHRDECYALKAYSYLAMNKAVICSDLPSMRTIIRHKENGYFIRAGDPDELCKALILLAKDGQLRKQLEMNARESVLKFSWDNIMDEVVANLIAKIPIRKLPVDNA